MTRALQSVLLLLLLMPSARAETIDRIVATVNGTPILESELEESIYIQQLLSGNGAGLDRAAELERLIDRALIQQQMERSSMPDPEEAEVNTKLAEVRTQLAPKADDAAWAAMLAAHGLSEADLRTHIALQLSVLRFVELRLRPSVYISDKDVEQYYQQSFLPRFDGRSGETPPPLREVSAQIREIVTQQRVDELLTQWLRARRAQTIIRRLSPLQNARTPAAEEVPVP